MTTRYVGPGGSNANDGLSWANRKLTLNGVEDTPVVAGDVVYVGPGVYREILTVDVSGSSGNPITYIGDVTGEHTDGVGGIVRVTGSDDDAVVTRGDCISISSKDYRTFRGFLFDMTSSPLYVTAGSCSGLIIEDCVFADVYANTYSISIAGTGTGNTVRRCLFIGGRGTHVYIQHTADVSNAGHLVENCIFLGNTQGYGVRVDNIGGVVIKNCTFYSCNLAAGVGASLAVGQTVTLNNSILAYCNTALFATTLGELVEDYNTFWGNQADRTTVNSGSNSIAYPPLFAAPLLLSKFKYPWWFGELSRWSPLAKRAGTGEASEDFRGYTRPTTSSKKSWGPIQGAAAVRETTTTQGSSTASIKIPDATEQFLMRVPVTNISTTISIYVYREADYAGTNPQMIIRQPGQADRTTTDAGSSATWNQLTDTFTPAVLPPYVDIYIKSNNTATTGNYDAFFDTLTVS